MRSVAPAAQFRQRVVKYAGKHSVTESAKRYRVSRKTIYVWRKRYDGTWQSLMEHSRRPHGHPQAHSQEEKDCITRYYRRNPTDMIVLWMKLREQGYQRSYRSMLREIRRLRLRPAGRQGGHRKPKPYQRAAYAGQKVQIDVKYVPGRCIADGQAYYQYTAIDECTRLVYREMYDEHSTYSSHDFLCKLIQTYPFAIREIQTDNGSEWTNALKANKPEEHLTLFEAELARQDILYHRIRVATPRHNGKVERQHRVDEVRFYSKLRMYSLADGRKQMQTYNRYSNTIPKLCLGLKSPNEVLALYLGVM